MRIASQFSVGIVPIFWEQKSGADCEVSPSPPKRLAEHIFHPPIEKSGSQLIGLSRVTRQRGQWHSTWVKPFGGELLDGGVQRGPPIEA